MFPGVIGGHCLIPNTELLLDAYDSEFLRLILKSNEKRKEEVKDEAVKAEVCEGCGEGCGAGEGACRRKERDN